jgi:putative ABC transport system permease protein
MFSNFFKVAFRVFIRDRIHTLINTFGLAIGLAFSIIIFLYVHKETSYDRFYKNAERIYRIGIKGIIADNIYNHAVTPAPLAGTLIREIPEIENAVRVGRFGAWLIRYGSIRYNEDNVIFADSTFFSIFSFPLIRGNPREVLVNPNSIVLSQQASLKYFGYEDPMGKLLRIENDSTYYKVTGIMENVPVNSHMHFDMVGSLSTFSKLNTHSTWVMNFMYTYILIRKGISPNLITQKLNQLVVRYVLPEYNEMVGIENTPTKNNKDIYTYVIQPVTDIHLKSKFQAEFEPVGNILYVKLFTTLAIITLILSCINFVSLATARSTNRAKEVSIRKLAGSEKNILVRQFLFESFLLAILSMALALLFTELFLPLFNRYIGLDLNLAQLLNKYGVLLMIVLILIIGLLSGLYPAYHHSSFNPVLFYHNRMDQENGRSYFRTSLVFFQFFISVGIIAITLNILSQYRYLIQKDLGFEQENLLVIRRSDGLKDKLEEFRRKVSRHPGIISVTNTNQIPGGIYSRNPFYLAGSPSKENYAATQLYVNYGFDSTFRITLLKGRFFDRRIKGDTEACVINEAAIRLMGLDDPVGKRIIPLSVNPAMNYEYNIIGIIKDFNYQTLENEIQPLVMILMPGNFEGYLAVRLTPDDQENTIRYLKSVWERYTNAYPFVSFFLNDELQKQYASVKETSQILFILSIVALLIASLGLFGLVSYSYNHRWREIGIRKAIGADAKRIIVHEINAIMILIMGASILAWTGAYFLIRSWLSDYAFHVNINIYYFILATLLVIVVALITVSYQASIAAKTNPGMALRYE